MTEASLHIGLAGQCSVIDLHKTINIMLTRRGGKGAGGGSVILALLSFSFFNSALYGYSLVCVCVADIYTDLKKEKNNLLIASGLTVSIGLSK